MAATLGGCWQRGGARLSLRTLRSSSGIGILVLDGMAPTRGSNISSPWSQPVTATTTKIRRLTSDGTSGSNGKQSRRNNERSSSVGSGRERTKKRRNGTGPSPAAAAPSATSLSIFPLADEVLVTCHPGLERCLSRELRALQIDHAIVTSAVASKRRRGSRHRTGAAANGAYLKLNADKNATTTIAPGQVENLLLKCHLYLGTASRILLRCGGGIRARRTDDNGDWNSRNVSCTFKARALGELRRKVSKMPWEDILKSDVRVRVKATSRKSRLLHTTAIENCVAQGVYAALGREPDGAAVFARVRDDNRDFEAEKDDDNMVTIRLVIVRDEVTVYIDTSATPVHRRGYRLETAKAPLREDMCYALLLLSTTNDGGGEALFFPIQTGRGISAGVAEEGVAFIDPFCGSGTIAIEAASMASGLPPGQLRPAPFQGTKLHDPLKWAAFVENEIRRCRKNRDSAAKPPTVRIIASDRDKGSIEAAISNARRAGLRDMIEFEHCAISSHPLLENPASAVALERLVVVTNPPFGRRIAASKGSAAKNSRRVHPLLPLYQTLSSRLESVADGSGCEVSGTILTDNPNLVRGCFQHDFWFSSGDHLEFSHGGIPVTAMSFRSRHGSRRCFGE